MPEPDEFISIAQRLMDKSTSGQRTIEALISGLHEASRRYQVGLGAIVGSLGVQLIMARALKKVSSRFPFLKDLAIYEDGIDAHSLLGQKSDADYEEVRRGFESLLAAIIEVLAELLGKDLATRLVLDWVLKS